MNKKRKKLLCLCCILGIILSLMILFILLGGVEKIRPLLLSIKAPASVTWDEYQSMNNEQKDQLFDRFDSLEAFEAWKESVQPKETEPDFQWHQSGKQPIEYTWEEYSRLTPEQQEAFFRWFSSVVEFETWKNQAQSAATTATNPVWSDSLKQPDQYTWKEYQALSPEEQDAFFFWFGSQEAFEAWMNAAKPAETKPSELTWDIPGKDPKEYTWGDYLALSPEKQEAFFQWFGSVEAFEAWMHSVKPVETQPEEKNWDKPGKTPDQYTWEEYQALSPEDQDAFFLWFGSVKTFEDWMDSVKPVETPPEEKTWDKPGKSPDEYTWKEYQALKPEDQELFYLWFASEDAFEAWLQQAQKQ